VYANNVAGRGFDIFYKRSLDGGSTWSTPVRLNDDGAPRTNAIRRCRSMATR
jgi:hypothetical protein